MSLYSGVDIAPAVNAECDLGVFPHANAVVSIRDDIVQLACDMVTRDGFATTIDGWIHENDAPGGAPVRVSTVAALCGVLLAAYVYRTTNDEKIANILFKEISADMRDVLGVRTLSHHSSSDAAIYQATNRALNRIIDVMDASVEVRNLTLSKKHHSKRPTFRELTADDIAVITSRRNWIVHELLAKTLAMLPRAVRRQYKGSLAVDGTFLKQFTQPTTRDEWSADPECAWYMRNNEAGEVRKKGFGMEATLAVMTDDEPNPRTAFPKLCLGMVLDQPGYRIGENGATVIAEVVSRSGVIHYVAVDRAYNNSIAEKFQLPVAAIRVGDTKQHAKFVFDYRDDQLGIQGSIAGALFIEGQLYCPSIPPRLINATIDYRAGTISDNDYATRIVERAKYLFKRKAEGRVTCPRPDPARPPAVTCAPHHSNSRTRSTKSARR